MDHLYRRYEGAESDDCIGNYYFVKVKTDDPIDYPIFYDDKKVPDCIISNVKYFRGWKSFPDCNNF